MKTTEFDYILPKEFIAQDPVEPRDSSKLMVFDTKEGNVRHEVFRDIGKYLKKGDVIVVNTSKVIPARILFDYNGKEREIFILRKLSEGRYLAMVRPGRIFKKGTRFDIDELIAEVETVNDDGTRVFVFHGKNIDDALEKLGSTPLPPYITDSHSDPSQYQTVYAKEKGSVAAPTAGFHFTKSLISDLQKKGVKKEEVVLHVGRGTFLPVTVQNIEDHIMHSERFELTKETADRLNKAKQDGCRVIAVGTTSVRVLETCFKNGKFVPKIAETDIYIYPGYKWRAVDALITNFHLPQSTLLMLVSSFLQYKGVENSTKKLLELYELAKKNKYRFFSFGDSMMIF